MKRSLLKAAFRPTDIASLAFFRIHFGAIMLWEVLRYFHYDRISRYWIRPPFNFTYLGFSWVHPWGGEGMYLHFIVLGILAFLIMVGLAYRLAAVLFFFGFTYVFLLEKTQYLNHFYLLGLVSFLLIFIPAHRAFSLDARLRPSLRTNVAPAWNLFLLRAQIGIAYFFAGLAKLTPDWLHGEPIRSSLDGSVHLPWFGLYYIGEPFVYFIAYSGLLFDLLVVPLLCWRRTRPFALGAAVLFHLSNSQLFHIGVFPWFMIGATLLFLDPGWPRKLLRRPSPEPVASWSPHFPRLTVALIAIYLFIQLTLPLRHHLYPGNVNWTEEGSDFAWRMKLNRKRGLARFYVTDTQTFDQWVVDPAQWIPGWQLERMQGHPDLVLTFSHYVRDVYRARTGHEVMVKAGVMASLNGREPQLLVDPEVDLARERRSLRHKPWIRPLTEPLAE